MGNFWEDKPLAELNETEWESLCDRCGRCCAHKLIDDETEALHFTRVACTLLDVGSCQCKNYPQRHQTVPDCITITPAMLADEAQRHWLPKTCAYKLLAEGQPLPQWHPLRTGRQESVAEAGISVAGRLISEDEIDEYDWESYIDPDIS